MATATRGPSIFTRRVVQPTIFIPPDQFALSGKVTIDGTNYTNRTVEIRITGRSIRDGLHDCTIILSNEDGFFIDKGTGEFIFEGGETVTIDYDYNTGGTRLFKGKMKYPFAQFSTGGHVLVVEARTAPEMADRRVTLKLDGSSFSAVKDVIANNISAAVTTTNFEATLASDTGQILASFDNSILAIVSEIFLREGWDGYLDFDPTDSGKHDLIAFQVDSQDNNDVNIVVGQNLLSVTRWGKDADLEANTVQVIGKSLGGAQILRTVRNQALIDKLWRQDKKVKDNSITTVQEAGTRATFELTRTIEVNHGSVTAIGNPKIVPGKRIRVSSQLDGLFGQFRVQKYTHIIGFSWQMNVDLVERTRRIFDDIEFRRKETERLTEFDNPNEMEASLNLDFDADNDSDNGIAANSLITYDSSLITITSGTVGTIESTVLTLSADVTKFDFTLKTPKEFVISTIEASNDGGANYVTGTAENTVFSFPSAGKRFRVRITLRADGANNKLPSLDGVTVRVK